MFLNQTPPSSSSLSDSGGLQSCAFLLNNSFAWSVNKNSSSIMAHNIVTITSSKYSVMSLSPSLMIIVGFFTPNINLALSRAPLSKNGKLSAIFTFSSLYSSLLVISSSLYLPCQSSPLGHPNVHCLNQVLHYLLK